MHDINWALARKRQNLVERARIIAQIRAFFTLHDYLEIETPHRIPANAPEVHIDPVESSEWVLHTSPELAMKRLLAAGHERIFQICRVWRGHERGRKHLPEFTLLEWYRAKVDYHQLMTDCEQLTKTLVPASELKYQGRTINIQAPWQRITVAEAFRRYASKSLEDAISADQFEELLTGEVEPNLGLEKPTFLIEYPASMAALARCKPGNPQVAERFELYINGMEIANAFSELTDPTEQRRRFEQDEQSRRAVGKPARPFPEKFLAELATMPESAGIALGVDRLVMLLTDSERIDDVVAFTPEEL